MGGGCVIQRKILNEQQKMLIDVESLDWITAKILCVCGLSYLLAHKQLRNKTKK